jgi:ABC-type multidrug transport system permease subunit
LKQLLIEIPYVFIQGAMYSLITYAMLNFKWTAAKFFWYFYIECTSLITFTFYGMMMVSITPNLVLSTVSSTFFYTVFNLYSGFLIPRPVSRFPLLI